MCVATHNVLFLGVVANIRLPRQRLTNIIPAFFTNREALLSLIIMLMSHCHKASEPSYSHCTNLNSSPAFLHPGTQCLWCLIGYFRAFRCDTAAGMGQKGWPKVH